MRSLCVSIAAMTAGCSFAFVSGPPNNHQKMLAFDCTSSNAAPTLDALWAGLNGAGAIVALAQSDQDYAGRSLDRATTIGVGLAWLALSGASAIYGYHQTAECRSAKDELNVRLLRLVPPRSDGVPTAALPSN